MPRAPDQAASSADDPVGVVLLDLLAACPAGRSLAPEQAARAFAASRAKPNEPPDPQAWRRYLPAVRQQALHLARQGRIVILRKGRPVDPNAPIRGVIRLAPGPARAPEAAQEAR